MKKIFLILFLICLLPFYIFTQTLQTSTIVVKSTVSKITLSQAAEGDALGLYKLYGGLESANYSSIDYILADDISKNDVTVFFRIAQEAKTRTDESIRLSVEAESLMNTDSQALISQDSDLLVTTEAPTISNIDCLGTDALTVTYSEEQKNLIQFMLSYSFGRPVENVNLAFFTTTWKKTEGLAPGLYTAKIILSYIMN